MTESEPPMGWEFVDFMVSEGMTREEAIAAASVEYDDTDNGPGGRMLGRGMVAEEAEATKWALLGYYEAKENRLLNTRVLLEYRCRRRCLLLHCWVGPLGRWVVLPPYKWSAARADGTGRWKPARAVLLDHLLDAGIPVLPLDCDHVSQYVDTKAVYADAQLGRAGKPRRVVVANANAG